VSQALTRAKAAFQRMAMRPERPSAGKLQGGNIALKK
jgi:hypothetical protein